MGIGINFGNTDDEDRPIGPFSHWLDDMDQNHFRTGDCNINRRDLLNKILKLPKEDQRWIRNKLIFRIPKKKK